MKIDNLNNYPGTGTFENIDEPKLLSDGQTTAYLVSNYAGLYGLVFGNEHHAILLFVTDSHPYASAQHSALALEPKAKCELCGNEFRLEALSRLGTGVDMLVVCDSCGLVEYSRRTGR